MVHPLKLLFSLIVMVGIALALQDSPVPTFEQRTSLDLPLLVSVPILHSLPVTPALAPRLTKLRKVYKRIKDLAIVPALQLRVFQAYALSSLDYLMQGVLIRQKD